MKYFIIGKFSQCYLKQNISFQTHKHNIDAEYLLFVNFQFDFQIKFLKL